MTDGRTLTRGRFTDQQREELRAAVALSRLEAEQESRRLSQLHAQAAPGPVQPSQVLRAARKARRAQNAKAAVAEMFDAPAERPWCGFCGLPSPNRDGVCVGHRDLGAAG